jgi:hypothetical protein
MARRPGEVRDAIINVMRERKGQASVSEIHTGVEKKLHGEVARSSVRSHLRLSPSFEQISRGEYKLRAGAR